MRQRQRRQGTTTLALVGRDETLRAPVVYHSLSHYKECIPAKPCTQVADLMKGQCQKYSQYDLNLNSISGKMLA